MDRFGYAKTIDCASYDKNTAQVDADNKYVIRCMNTDRICIFTQTGVMHQLKMTKLPLKKIKDKGIPIDNLCNYTSESETIIGVYPMNSLKMSELLFTTKFGMMKFVDASEFDVIKKTVAATKLSPGDEVVSIVSFDASDRKVYTEFEYDDDDFGPLISGGSDMDYDFASDEENAATAGDASKSGGAISQFTDDDDQLTFEFFDINGGVSEQVSLSMEDGEAAAAAGRNRSACSPGSSGWICSQ